jgi:DNA repair exonuclease SbcCD ATPase subunit
MSQTETLLLFVLGFCVALFVVLLFGRGVWAMMGTWAGWRDQRRQPAAILELQAERDSLKAEKAMMAQKLEATVNDLKMRMAEQMAEVSRTRNRFLDLNQTVKEREAVIAHLQAQLDEKMGQNQSLTSQIEENVKAINAAYANMAQREQDNASMQHSLHETQAAVMQRDERIYNLMDESKAMRELVNLGPAINAIINPATGQTLAEVGSDRSHRVVAHFAKPAVVNSFDARFANINSSPAPAEDAQDEEASETDDVDREVSNVLSLADRVRSLQSGMKK